MYGINLHCIVMSGYVLGQVNRTSGRLVDGSVGNRRLASEKKLQ